MIKSPLPETRTEQGHLQLPVQAVKIFLDRAIETMYNNDGISVEDWDYFRYCGKLIANMEPNENIQNR